MITYHDDKIYERVTLTFCIYSQNKSDEDLKEKIYKTGLKLETIQYKKKPRRPHPSTPKGRYIINTEDYINSADINEHFDWLLSYLLEAKEGLLNLQKEEGIKIKLSCVFWLSENLDMIIVFTLTSKNIKKISKLNLNIDFEVTTY